MEGILIKEDGDGVQRELKIRLSEDYGVLITMRRYDGLESDSVGMYLSNSQIFDIIEYLKKYIE